MPNVSGSGQPVIPIIEKVLILSYNRCQKPILGQTTPRDQRQAYGYNLLAESDRLSRARRELESLFDRHVLLNVPIPGFSRKWSRVARRACGDQLLAEIHRLNAARHKVDDLFDMYIIGDTPIPDHAQKSYAGPSILGPGFLMSTCEPGSNISSAEQMVFGQAKTSSFLETSGSADLSPVSTPLPPSPESMPPPPRPTAASLAVGSEPYPTEFEFWQTHRRAGGARFPA